MLPAVYFCLVRKLWTDHKTFSKEVTDDHTKHYWGSAVSRLYIEKYEIKFKKLLHDKTERKSREVI